MTIPEESRCKVRSAILCDFMVTFSGEESHIEVCKNCHRREVYRKKNGRIDTAKYGRDHLRDFLQPRGDMRELYIRIYGGVGLAAREKADKERKGKPDWEEVRLEAHDRIKTMRRSSVNYGY